MRVVKFVAAALLAALPHSAFAQQPKSGGTLRIYQRDSLASASIHEEATFSVVVPYMSVFNNLAIFKQDVPQNTPASIVPDLALSWSWSADNLALTFKLRDGVKWHDGKPFTAADVKCTMDLLQDKAPEKFLRNPRKTWYENVRDVVTNGPLEVTFKLGHPQPSLLSLLASGYSPIYPCHVTPAQMRKHPIGTGPFKFVEYTPNERIRLVKNPDYWKPGRPYLDAIELPIMGNRSAAMLAFTTGKLDMTFPTEITVAVMPGIKQQRPNSVCSFGTTNLDVNLIVNSTKPPFDNPAIRRAMALAIDRGDFIEDLYEGKAQMGGSLLPPPAGIWGMPTEMLRTATGYGADVEKNRTEARAIMEKLGYGPTNTLKVKVSTRNVSSYRDAAVILIDQLKQIYIDGEFDLVESAAWFPKVARGEYAVGMNVTANAVDDPDQTFFENYTCHSERNYSHYCNPDLEKLFVEQSSEPNLEKRRKLVWEIDHRIQDDVARPVILHFPGGTCWAPELHGYTPMVNSIVNGYRFEDLWLDR